jgi:hypothetical protein
MHTLIPRLLTLSALRLLFGCASQPRLLDHQGIDWPTRINQVAIGMTRAEVDDILPAWRGPAGALLSAPRITTITGGGSVHVYWVREDWRVTIFYDNAGGMGSDQNQVRKPVTIEKVTYGTSS